MGSSSKFNARLVGLLTIIWIIGKFYEGSASPVYLKTDYHDDNNNDILLADEEQQYTIPYEGICDYNFKDEKCITGLSCISNQCLCPHEPAFLSFPKFMAPNNQYYDKEKKLCVTTVNGLCDDNKRNDIQQCVPHASCSKKENGVSKCKCDPGFVDFLGECDIAFGEKCPLESAQCDRSSKSSCIDGRCKCNTEIQIYDEDTHRCRSLVGSPCNFYLDCAFGSKCVKRVSTSPDEGTCKCMERWFSLNSINKTCHWNIHRFDSSLSLYIVVMFIGLYFIFECVFPLFLACMKMKGESKDLK